MIEHEDLVAFAQINNSFSSQYDGTGDCDNLKNAWSGLLFQIGEYGQTDCGDNDGVDIVLATGDTISLKTDQFDWINIVAERSALAASAVPMLTSEVNGLFPKDSLSSTCAGAAFHKDMGDVLDIITVWQGSGGYDLEGRYDAPEDSYATEGRQNSYGLVLNDEFEVWVYNLGDDCVPSLPAGYDESSEYVTGGVMHLTNVSEIRVKWKAKGGSGNGVRMDPPMP